MTKSRRSRKWPAPPGPAAYHGLIGDYVKAVAPHSESDPAAILVQTIICFGNAAGRKPHFYVEDDRHGCLLHGVVVGSTGAARKGTSLGRARALVRAADSDWGMNNSGEGGLSSAEGLISAVRDPSRGDPGMHDKRLLAAMGEFGETLERMRNEGNTLGQTIRNAWDLKPLRTRTRNPLVATNPFISVIGHITEEELKTLLTKTHIYGGFANRFLWVLAKRARSLPFGGSIRIADLPEIVNSTAAALAWADKKERVIKFSAKARREWRDVYEDLTAAAEREAKFGATVERAAPIVRRIALIFAVADRSPRVDLVHLKAGLEVWRYCEDSAEYIFADAPRPGVEGKIEKLLQQASPEWVAREVVNRKLKNVSAYRMDAAIANLDGDIEKRTVKTRGRPREEYRVR